MEPNDLVKKWVAEKGGLVSGQTIQDYAHLAQALYDKVQGNATQLQMYGNTPEVALSFLQGQVSSSSGSRLGDPSDYSSAVVGSGSTSSSDPWQSRVNAQKDLFRNGTFVGNTDNKATFQTFDGKFVSFPILQDGTIDYSNEIESMSAMDELDYAYKQAQLIKLLGGGSGSGGSGRTVFPWEQQGAELDNQLKQLQLDAARNPSSRFTNVNGYMVDSLTGQLVDPSDLGVSRFNADTSRQLANFQTGPQFEETKRQFDVNAGREALAQQSTSRLQAAQTEATLGNLGLDRSRFITEVLRNPADGLARIYSQRGGVSPLQQISMADILNSFNNQTAGIRDATNANLARLGGTQVGFPAVKPPVAPAAIPSVYPDYNSTNPEEPGGAYNPANTDTPYDGWYDPGAEQQQLMTQDVNPGGSYGIQEALELLQADANAGRLARGGYTNKSRFIVGDQRSGVPTGHEELVVNPTNAPIAVVPNKMLPKVSRFTGPRYDEGTGSYGPRRVLEAKPTGGFWNSLREVLGGVEDKVNDASSEAQSRFQSDYAADPMQFAMGPGSAIGSVDDVAKMFTRMSTADKLKMAAEKGYRTDHLDPTEVLRASRNAARDAYTKASKAYIEASKSNKFSDEAMESFKNMTRFRKDFNKLEDELAQVEKAARPSQMELRREVMEQYDEAVSNVKSLGKAADDYIATESGGAFESVEDVMREMESIRGAGRTHPGTANRYLALNKLMGGSPAAAYAKAKMEVEDIANRLLRFGGNNPAEGVDDVSRFADGTLFQMPAGSINYGQPDQFAHSSTYDLGYGGTTTQNELIDMSRIAAGPGGNAVLGGNAPAPFRIPGLPTPTYRQFSSLSEAEREALRPRLAAEFNSTLEDLMFDIQQRYGTNQSRMARFRG